MKFVYSGCVVFLCASVLVVGAPPTVNLANQIAKASHEHPRLFATARDFEQVRLRIKNDDRMQQIWMEVSNKADGYLTEKPLERIRTGRRLLGVSRKALDRILALGMAYQITGDQKYLDRGTLVLESIAAFSDWNPSHFLDVAEMTAAMAIGYDWLYDGLSPELRKELRNALIEKGFKPSFAKNQWWVRGSNNWNPVCNGGLTLGALAILEDEPVWAERIVARAIDGVPVAMRASYAPSGTYPEGPAYWVYGTSYNVLLIAVLQEILGSDFGLCAMQGFDRTGEYLNQAIGPTGRTFNYADGGPALLPAPPALFWLARQFKHPDWVTVRLDTFDASLQRMAQKRLFPLVLLWVPPAWDSSKATLALDWKGTGTKPVAMHRSGWGPEATWVGICAGMASSSHGHMDTGSFVFECDGVRWADDLGSENYHRLESKGIGLWDSRQKGGRWTIFRLNNLSHNTLTIGGAHQQVDGFSKIISFSEAKDCPHTAVDMTPAYRDQAKKAVRTFSLPKRQHLVVCDQLEGLPNDCDVTWQMVTGASVTLASKQEALLQKDGKTLRVRLLQPTGAEWIVRDASKPMASHDSPNPGKSILGFSVLAPASGKLSCLVVLEPDSIPRLPAAAAKKLKSF